METTHAAGARCPHLPDRHMQSKALLRTFREDAPARSLNTSQACADSLAYCQQSETLCMSHMSFDDIGHCADMRLALNARFLQG